MKWKVGDIAICMVDMCTNMNCPGCQKRTWASSTGGKTPGPAWQEENEVTRVENRDGIWFARYPHEDYPCHHFRKKKDHTKGPSIKEVIEEEEPEYA